MNTFTKNSNKQAFKSLSSSGLTKTFIRKASTEATNSNNAFSYIKFFIIVISFFPALLISFYESDYYVLRFTFKGANLDTSLLLVLPIISGILYLLYLYIDSKPFGFKNYILKSLELVLSIILFLSLSLYKAAIFLYFNPLNSVLINIKGFLLKKEINYELFFNKCVDALDRFNSLSELDDILLTENLKTIFKEKYNLLLSSPRSNPEDIINSLPKVFINSKEQESNVWNTIWGNLNSLISEKGLLLVGFVALAYVTSQTNTFIWVKDKIFNIVYGGSPVERVANTASGLAAQARRNAQAIHKTRQELAELRKTSGIELHDSADQLKEGVRTLRDLASVNRSGMLLALEKSILDSKIHELYLAKGYFFIKNIFSGQIIETHSARLNQIILDILLNPEVILENYDEIFISAKASINRIKCELDHLNTMPVINKSISEINANPKYWSSKPWIFK